MNTKKSSGLAFSAMPEALHAVEPQTMDTYEYAEHMDTAKAAVRSGFDASESTFVAVAFLSVGLYGDVG